MSNHTTTRFVASYDDRDTARQARDGYADQLRAMGLAPRHTVGVEPRAGAYAVVLHVTDDAHPEPAVDPHGDYDQAGAA